MNRRGFISAILGTAAATALPSEIWPFRKIFLPAAPVLDYYANLFLTSPSSWFGLGAVEMLLDPVSGEFRPAKLISTGVDSSGSETYFVAPDPTWPKEIHPAGNYRTIKREPATLEGLNEYDAERWKLLPQPYANFEGCNSVLVWPRPKRYLKTLQ